MEDGKDCDPIIAFTWYSDVRYSLLYLELEAVVVLRYLVLCKLDDVIIFNTRICIF